MRGFVLVVCMVLFAMPVLVACDVDTPDPNHFTVNFDFRAGGSVVVEIDGEEINHATTHIDGSILTITLTPDEGYQVLSVKAGTTDLIFEGVAYEHTLSDNVTLRVRFAPIP